MICIGLYWLCIGLYWFRLGLALVFTSLQWNCNNSVFLHRLESRKPHLSRSEAEVIVKSALASRGLGAVSHHRPVQGKKSELGDGPHVRRGRPARRHRWRSKKTSRGMTRDLDLHASRIGDESALVLCVYIYIYIYIYFLYTSKTKTHTCAPARIYKYQRQTYLRDILRCVFNPVLSVSPSDIYNNRLGVNSRRLRQGINMYLLVPLTTHPIYWAWEANAANMGTIYEEMSVPKVPVCRHKKLVFGALMAHGALWAHGGP